MSQSPNRQPSRFSLGDVVATPGALDALREAQQEPLELLRRHQAGDWGDLDEEDKAETSSVSRMTCACCQPTRFPPRSRFG